MLLFLETIFDNFGVNRPYIGRFENFCSPCSVLSLVQIS